MNLPQEWPLPQLQVPDEELSAWKTRRGLAGDPRPIVALCPGAVGAGKAWPPGHYADLASTLTRSGAAVWVLGSPAERRIANGIVAAAGPHARDLTGTDLRDAVLALASADTVVSNDSGLMHVAAALGTPTIGIFGPTSPYHWAPLNGLAATVQQTRTQLSCQPCHRPVCRMNDHRCMRDIPASDVVETARRVLAQSEAKS
jgi:heptosyltransferase-2